MTHCLPEFTHFVAIDWSGAKGVHHKGIAIALAQTGTSAPKLVPPPSPKGWSRGQVADWLEALDERVLVGFDFSFAPPYLDHKAYLPNLTETKNPKEFWAIVDVASQQDADYGAHSFMNGPARSHFWMGAADGPKAAFMRLRQCESLFNMRGGGKPSSVFDCVGAAQVSKASFAGMRVLHRLQNSFAIWPFDPPAQRTIVEIYTRAMLQLAGGRGLKVRDMNSLNNALEKLDCQPIADGAYSDHQNDVLVAAAALRQMAQQLVWWFSPNISIEAAETEGWTFGIA